MKTLLLAAAIAVAHSASAAGPVSAVRYVDAQGVEMIHDRGAPAPAAAGGGSGKAGDAPSGQGARAAASDARLQVAPAEQAARDLDRVAILEEELGEEKRAYAALWTRANDKAQTAKLAAPELAALRERLARHARNIQALNDELRRVRRQP